MLQRLLAENDSVEILLELGTLSIQSCILFSEDAVLLTEHLVFRLQSCTLLAEILVGRFQVLDDISIRLQIGMIVLAQRDFGTQSPAGSLQPLDLHFVVLPLDVLPVQLLDDVDGGRRPSLPLRSNATFIRGCVFANPTTAGSTGRGQPGSIRGSGLRRFCTCLGPQRAGSLISLLGREI